jgi:hypothetical protein
MNETENRKTRRNLKNKISIDSNPYQPASPYTVNQSGFSTMNPLKNLETIPDDIPMSNEEGKVS